MLEGGSWAAGREIAAERAAGRRPAAHDRQRRHAVLRRGRACQGLVTVVDHPLVRHKLSLMRARDTSTAKFRRLMREISLLLGYEATRDLALEETEIETPLERGARPGARRQKTVPGVDPARRQRHSRRACSTWCRRRGSAISASTASRARLQAIEYYLKLPDDLPERDVILVDPMLATGNSAVAAISRLVELRARSIKFVCLVAAPEGIENVHRVFPGRPDPDRCDRPRPQRPRLYPARPRRRRRPPVRHQIAGGAAASALPPALPESAALARERDKFSALLGRQDRQEFEGGGGSLALEPAPLLGRLVKPSRNFHMGGIGLGDLFPGAPTSGAIT